MLILTQTTDKIQVVLGGNVTTSQLQCMSSYRDITTTTYLPGRTVINTNNTTDVDLVGAPGSSTQRVIDWISIYNADTVNATVTIKFDANGTEYVLFKGVVGTGEMLQYTDKTGFFVLTSNGSTKQSQQFNSGSPVINTLNVVVLSGDVINNNATANTIQDVTGLSFAATADYTYWFEFVIPYTAAATTTGSRWSINGPAFSRLNMRSEYTLAATTITVNSITAYNAPAASNATSLKAGNLATMWGIIVPSENGNVIARFASEVSGSAITAKAGATLRYMRII